jgi:hypothetical protein
MKASELNEILEQHQLWLYGKGGKCANLTGANLNRADLMGANLRDADLMGANLYCASLGGAKFSDADLTGADLTGTNLTKADLRNANLNGVNLTRANLSGADLHCAYLHGTIGLPDVSWIIPGCLVQLNRIIDNGIWLIKEIKWVNFVQDSIGFFIQNNVEEETFDMLAGDRIIRNIPGWVKYTGLRQIESELV